MDKNDFLKNFALVNENIITFEMSVCANELFHNEIGINYLNNLVDDFVVDGYMLEDLSYSVLRGEDHNIIVQVTAEGTKFLEGVE